MKPPSRKRPAPDVARALSALVNACVDAFSSPREAASWARTGDMRGYISDALAALRRDQEARDRRRARRRAKAR